MKPTGRFYEKRESGSKPNSLWAGMSAFAKATADNLPRWLASRNSEIPAGSSALLRPLPEREPLAGATKGILRSGWHAIRSSEIPAVRLR